MKSHLIPALILAALPLTGTAATTISAELPYAWSENVGWIDMRGDGESGVIVTSKYLSGYAWSENIGWISFGITPADGIAYTQATGDTGINRNPFTGALTGYGWGENIGWISFGVLDVSGQQVVCDATGTFAGYAWSENIGWINFDSGHGVKSAMPPEDPTGWMLLGE